MKRLITIVIFCFILFSANGDSMGIFLEISSADDGLSAVVESTLKKQLQAYKDIEIVYAKESSDFVISGRLIDIVGFCLPFDFVFTYVNLHSHYPPLSGRFYSPGVQFGMYDDLESMCESVATDFDALLNLIRKDLENIEP